MKSKISSLEKIMLEEVLEMKSKISSLEKIMLEEDWQGMTVPVGFSGPSFDIPSYVIFGTADIEVAPFCHCRTSYSYNPETMLLQVQGRRPMFVRPHVYHAAKFQCILFSTAEISCWL